VVLVFRRSAQDARAFDQALELDRDGRLASPLLPGIQLAVSELFPPARDRGAADGERGAAGGIGAPPAG